MSRYFKEPDDEFDFPDIPGSDPSPDSKETGINF